jgi:electron transfer flavoprotein beta subunit
MKIVVLVKQVPDSSTDRVLREDSNTVDRQSASNVVNEMDEYAIEEALRVREAHGGEVVVLTVGPSQAGEAVRKALQLGVDRGVHVVDEALAGSCAVGTSRVLAAALGRLGADLVLCGAESTDGRGQVMAHMVAERLGIAALTGARRLSVDGGVLTVERQTEEGYEVVTASVPAVVSVWDTINQVRLASFKGIMAAKKKPVEVWSLADVGVSAEEVGVVGATSEVVSHRRRPPRSQGQRVVDDGSGGVRLVEFLAAEKFV